MFVGLHFLFPVLASSFDAVDAVFGDSLSLSVAEVFLDMVEEGFFDVCEELIAGASSLLAHKSTLSFALVAVF